MTNEPRNATANNAAVRVVADTAAASTKQLTPESSTIASIEHDGNKLIVEFKSGGTYHYDAPASVFEQMKAADSKGKFHHSDIKGKYQHTKVA